MPSSLPQTIGRYRVVEALGEGAMGEVVRARDERLGRDVAIKRVKNPGGEGLAEFQARFEAEARALAALAHPGVVQIFELGLEGDEPYLVMELVDGQSLRAVIKERGPLPEPSVRALGIQLARALEAAHARGILHRDVKPANVLQAPGGGWKLADFGVAHMPDSEMTSTGQFIGTPAYAAPEALALAQFSPASDVYGLAATLVEAASGRKPRKDATLAELMAKSHEGATLEGVSDELAAILRPALALDARARPSAGELAELLAGSPETGQILQSMAARAASGPAFVAAGEQETRVGGARRKSSEGGEAGRAMGSAVHTVGVPDETGAPRRAQESRAAATVALRGEASSPAIHTVAVPDETRAGAPSAGGVSAPPRLPSQPSLGGPTPMPVPMPTPLPMAAPVASAMATPMPLQASYAAQASHDSQASHAPQAAQATLAATAAVAMPHGGAAPRRMSGRQMIGVAAGLVVVLAVIGRACSEEPHRSSLGFPTGAQGEPRPRPPGPGSEPRPEPPRLGEGPAGRGEPLRFDPPPGLDHKGARDWMEVGRSINEGKLNKALDKLDKLEHRYGESPESARLRDWLEQNAGGPRGDED